MISWRLILTRSSMSSMLFVVLGGSYYFSLSQVSRFVGWDSVLNFHGMGLP